MSLTPERIIYVRGSIIVIGEVKNRNGVFRITVDSEFRGYIQNVSGDFHMMYGCKLSIYKFNTIVEAIMIGIEKYNKL